MTAPLQSWLRRQPARLALRRGIDLARKGNHADAIAAFTQALAQHPAPAVVYGHRAKSYWHCGDCQAALADYDRAVQADPTAVSAYSDRALLRQALGDEAGALDDWAIALGQNPRVATVRYNRGLFYLQKAQYTAALADFDMALAVNPLLAEAYLHRGRVRHALGDAPGAVKDWEMALCNDLRLEEAQQWLRQVSEAARHEELRQQLQAVLPHPDLSLQLQQRHDCLILSVHRPVGTPVNYFNLPNLIRDQLVALQVPNVRRFRLIAQAGEATLAEWDQTYGVYDRVPCPPARWGAALATALMLFPPFGVVALIFAAQVKQAYKRGDYPMAARASKSVRGLFLSSSVLAGLMLFFLAGYGVYNYVEVEYPNPYAKTAMAQSEEAPESEEAVP